MKLLNLKQTNHKTNWRFKLGMISLISMVFCILTGAVFNVADAAYICTPGGTFKYNGTTYQCSSYPYCTQVNMSTCNQVGSGYVPDFASRSACQICPKTSNNTVGSTWVSYPQNGTPNSAEEYVYLPAQQTQNFQPVHMWTARLGCNNLSGIRPGAHALVGAMSLRSEYAMSYDYANAHNINMNNRLQQYARGYTTYYDPALHTVPLSGSTVPLKYFQTGNGWREFVNLRISRSYAFKKGYMQYPGYYGGAKVDMRQINSRCAAQFDQNNYANRCNLTVYLGASAENGYALLDEKATLRIQRQMPAASVIFTGSVSRSHSSAKIGDQISFTHRPGATYIGVVRNAKAVYSFSGTSITSPSASKTITVNYNGQTSSSQSQTVIERHTVTLADAQNGQVCRTISWTSSGTSPIPGNNPSTRKATVCIPIAAPTCTYTFVAPKTTASPTSVNVNQVGVNQTVTFTHPATNASRTGNTNTCYRNKSSTQSASSPNNSRSLRRDINNTGSFTTSKSFSINSLHGAKLCHVSSINPGKGNYSNENGGAVSGVQACSTANRLGYDVRSGIEFCVGGASTTYATCTNWRSTNSGSAARTIKPNDKVFFRHRVWSAAGNNVTDRINISRYINYSGTAGSQTLIGNTPSANITLPSGKTNNNVQVSTMRTGVSGAGVKIYEGSSRTVTNQYDLGKRICERTTIAKSNTAFTNGTIHATQYPHVNNSSWACVDVPYNYTLTPGIKLDNDLANTAATPGEKVNVVGEVNKGSNDTWSRNTQWQLTKFIVPGGANPKPGADNGSVPCTYFKHGSNLCQVVKHETGKVFTGAHTKLYDQDVSVENLAIGTKVCFALSVQPFSHSSDLWRHSEPHCITVSKAPKAQIHGSSLTVPGGKIRASVTTTATTASHPPCVAGSACRYGSWMEYDILARGTIVNTASAVGYPAVPADPLAVNRHRLTFANVRASENKYGEYYSGSDTNQANRIASYYLGLAGSPNARIGATTASANVYSYANSSANQGTFDIYYQKSSTPLELTSSAQPTIPVKNPAKTVIIIKEGGDLKIRQNLTYQSTGITGLRSQPQLILIVKDGNIVIDPGVTQVDAWLIATSIPARPKRGRLLTCETAVDGSGRPTLSASICNQPLRINGPVVVDYLDLYRTHGSEVVPANTMDQPAELFNFRPDAYLWSYANSSSGKVILETTYTKELPVRF